MPVNADQQKALADPMSDGMPSPTNAAGGAKTAIDPVCGMTVTVKADTRTESFDGKPFHFCSDKCQTKFKGDPWFYASGNASKRGKVATAGVQYTCPMHPQILRDAPGSCPICGMALEPMVPSDAPSEELTDFTKRMWISAAAAVPLVVLTMGPLVGLPRCHRRKPRWFRLPFGSRRRVDADHRRRVGRNDHRPDVDRCGDDDHWFRH